MRILVVARILAVSLLFAPGVRAEDAAPPEKKKPTIHIFEGTWAQAREKAGHEGRLIMAFWSLRKDAQFNRNWANWADAEFIDTVNARCVNIQLIHEDHADLAKDQDVTKPPCVVIADSDGTPLELVPGDKLTDVEVLKALQRALKARKAKPSGSSGTGTTGPGTGSTGSPGTGTPGSGSGGTEKPAPAGPVELAIPGDLVADRVLPGVSIAGFARAGTIVRFARKIGFFPDNGAPPPPDGVKVVYVTDSAETKLPAWAERVVLGTDAYDRLMTALRHNLVRSDNQFSYVFNSEGRQAARCIGLAHRLQDLYAFCRAMEGGFTALNRQDPGSALAKPDENPFVTWVAGMDVWQNDDTVEGVMTLPRGQVYLQVVSGSRGLARALSIDGVLFRGEERDQPDPGVWHSLSVGKGFKTKAKIQLAPLPGNAAPRGVRLDIYALRDADLSEPEIFPEKPAGAKVVQLLTVWANTDKPMRSEVLKAGRRYILEVTGTVELAPALSSMQVQADAAYLRSVKDKGSRYFGQEPVRQSSLLVNQAAFEPREDANSAYSYSMRVDGEDAALELVIRDANDGNLKNNAGGFTVTIWDAGEGKW